MKNRIIHVTYWVLFIAIFVGAHFLVEAMTIDYSEMFAYWGVVIIGLYLLDLVQHYVLNGAKSKERIAFEDGWMAGHIAGQIAANEEAGR